MKNIFKKNRKTAETFHWYKLETVLAYMSDDDRKAFNDPCNPWACEIADSVAMIMIKAGIPFDSKF